MCLSDGGSQFFDFGVAVLIRQAFLQYGSQHFEFQAGYGGGDLFYGFAASGIGHHNASIFQPWS